MKRQECGSGLKIMIQLFAAYKRLTLDPKTKQVVSEKKENIFYADNNKKRGEAALISANIDFK